MDNAFGVHVLDRASHLDRPKSYLWLGNVFSFLDHVHQRSIGTKLQNDVCALFVRECSMKLDDIRVVHLGMNLEFCLELLLHLLLWHVALDNLQGVSLLRSNELSIVADCESSLAQAFACFVNSAIRTIGTYAAIQSAKLAASHCPDIFRDIWENCGPYLAVPEPLLSRRRGAGQDAPEVLREQALA